MKGNLWVLPALFSSFASLNADVIAQWNFNSPTLDGDASTGTTAVSQGAGAATLVGGTAGSFVSGDTRHDPAGTADNSAWRTAKYPGAESANQSAGVRFDIDTTGYENVGVNWWQQNSATASRYARLQYTVDGFSFFSADGLATCIDGVFTNLACDLSEVPGVANNPSFGFQIVTEWESAATGAGADAYVATKDGSKYGSSGAIRFDLVTVSGTPIPGANTPPCISTVSNQVLRVNQCSAALGFTIGDKEDSPDRLVLGITSSDPAVIPLSSVALRGSGKTRTVSVNATEQIGVCWIGLSVTDSGGRIAETTFKVTVLPANLPPEISLIPGTNTLANRPIGPLPFLVGDAETPADSLGVSGRSDNESLVPSSNVFFGGTGSNRTVMITPAPGQSGVAPIHVSVNDGTNEANISFPLLVRPSQDVVFCDHFGYADGSLLTNSAFLWNTRSGVAGQCLVHGEQLQLCATQTEDVVAHLVGAPYAKSNSTVLYATFKVHFLTLPKPVPGLFAHFASGSTLRGRVYAGTTNAAQGCFRLQVANGTGMPVELPMDLDTNTSYRVVTRYVVDSALTTLWLNPAAESDDGVSAYDAQTASSISSYGFRQDPDLGATLWIDDLVVGLSFVAVTKGKTVGQVKLTAEWDGTNLRLRWPDASLVLQSATTVAGPYRDVVGAASPYTRAVDGYDGFFRLKSQ